MAMCDLKCTPCRGGVAPLGRAQAEERLAALAAGWELSPDGTAISRQFKTKTFREALALANRIGDLADAEGHHPVLTIGWGRCGVSFNTHKINGLHDNDFIMAAKVDALVGG